MVNMKDKHVVNIDQAIFYYICYRIWSPFYFPKNQSVPEKAYTSGMVVKFGANNRKAFTFLRKARSM